MRQFAFSETVEQVVGDYLFNCLGECELNLCFKKNNSNFNMVFRRRNIINIALFLNDPRIIFVKTIIFAPSNYLETALNKT